MANFTNGPWTWRNPHACPLPHDTFNVSSTDRTIAKVLCGWGDSPEHEANAHLIAAAPELYDLAIDGSMNVVGDIMQNYADQLEREGFGKVLDLLRAWDEKALATLARARGEK